MGGGSTWQPKTESPLCWALWVAVAQVGFCLLGQRQFLLQENPGAFDLRLPVSLSHLESGVQARLPGDLPTLPLEGPGSRNSPFFPYFHLLTRASVPTFSCRDKEGPQEVFSQMPPPTGWAPGPSAPTPGSP